MQSTHLHRPILHPYRKRGLLKAMATASASRLHAAEPDSTDESLPDELPQSDQFDREDFCAATWLNGVLSSGNSSSDGALSALARAVDESLHKAHILLDRSLSRALISVPWAVRESEKVRQRANTLRASVDGVGERVAGVEAGVTSAVDTLARADDVVRRVESVFELLTQAADAERLQARLESLLAASGDSADLVAAADVLADLRAQLRPLSDIPQLAEQVRALDVADAKLEALAAPQLRAALETRNGGAAANARVVFDRAGRENAFVAQYVAIRAAQIAKLWNNAWEAWVNAPPIASDVDVAVEKGRRRALRGDLSAEGAHLLLAGFYANLEDLMRTEAAWLDTAFPDLRLRLLPSLLVAALADVRNPALRAPAAVIAEDVVKCSRQIPDRMHAAARQGVMAAGRICTAVFPSWNDELFKDDGFVQLAVEAVSAALAPHRLFLDSLSDAYSRAARAATNAITMSTEPFFVQRPRPKKSPATVGADEGPVPLAAPQLSEVARDVESVATRAVAVLDDTLGAIAAQTVGLGMSAMTRVASTVVSELSMRLLRILRHNHTLCRSRVSDVDEWARVNGALRLLHAVSTLKREWDLHKETALGAAFAAVTPAIERANADGSEMRLLRFVDDATQAPDMAAAVWELGRDETLAQRVYATFENAVAADFADVVTAVHKVVYECMMAGVQTRFRAFAGAKTWSASRGDTDAPVGVASSPLSYATEVADFLMTVPQQLEPFVPEEEDAEHATPQSVYAFSTRSTKAPDDELNTSFAAMWIHVLAVGTMELYVERICGIAKLSDLGTRQLAVDTEYMCNVLSALGVNPTAEMALTRRLLECVAESATFEAIADDAANAEQRKLIRRVAAVRGVSVTL